MTGAGLGAARVVRFDGSTQVVAVTPLELGVSPAVGIGEVRDGLWLLPQDLQAARRLAAAAGQVVTAFELLARVTPATSGAAS